jgi:hypothetical protein
MEIRVTLFATPHDVQAALLEPAFGPVLVQANGARVRTMGLPGHVGAVSAYRNIFISSSSIDAPRKTIPVAAQLRVHRAIETRFRSL